MDALTLILQLAFRSLVILLPVLIGWLAFRRLTKSRSSNAWIYAVSCLFAAVTTAGLLPWAVGLSASSWVFFVFAAFCPAIWFGVTTICDVSRHTTYDVELEDPLSVLFKAHRRKPNPLLLVEPLGDAPAVQEFSRTTLANTDAPAIVAVEKPEPIKERSVLEVARAMRRNKSSEDRRPKMLAAPLVKEIPYIKSSGTA